jgi:hypothetical protein
MSETSRSLKGDYFTHRRQEPFISSSFSSQVFPFLSHLDRYLFLIGFQRRHLKSLENQGDNSYPGDGVNFQSIQSSVSVILVDDLHDDRPAV